MLVPRLRAKKKTAALFGLLTVVGPCAARASAGDVLIPCKSGVVKSGRMATFVCKPTSTFALPQVGGADDPARNGATLRLFDTDPNARNAGDATFNLPAGAAWSTLGNPPGTRGFRYRGAGTPADPCRMVRIKDTVIRGVCASIPFPLTTPFLDGDLGICLAVGTGMEYCAQFGGTAARDNAVAFKRKDANAPSTCPVALPSDTTPEELARYRAAADYSRARNGFAVLVQKGGRIVFEDYQVQDGIPASPVSPHRLASGTKSFWGVAACAAVTDGILELDEQVSDTITEWQNDPLKRAITVRQLLTLTSGLEPAGVALQDPSVRDQYDYAINQLQMEAVPGEKFAYGPGPFAAFGAFLARKLADTHEDPLDYLRRRILDPIGLEVAWWSRDGAGNPLMAAGAFLTAREWAKFGELIKNQGEWQGTPLVDPDVLAESFNGTDANPAYGLTWWLNKSGYGVIQGDGVWIPVPSTPILPERIPDLIRAMGHGKQRLYIIPSHNLVIVRFGESEGLGWLDTEFLGLVFGQ